MKVVNFWDHRHTDTVHISVSDIDSIATETLCGILKSEIRSIDYDGDYMNLEHLCIKCTQLLGIAVIMTNTHPKNQEVEE
jgi:hypothetical protein